MRRLLPALMLGLSALAAAPAAAPAAVDRAEYVTQVDPICEQAIGPIAKAAKPLAKADKRLAKDISDPDLTKREARRALNRYFKAAGRVLTRVNTVFGRMVERIAAVPPAPGDELVVQQWIETLRATKGTSDRTIRAFKRGKLRKAQRLSDRAARLRDEADALVRDFGFQYC